MTEALSEPTVTYELDHMASFSLSTKQRLVKPMDALERLREMESTIGVWTMKVTLRINGQKVVVSDRATNKVLLICHCRGFNKRIESELF